MSKDVLERIGQLEGIDVTKAELNVGIDNKLSETKNFAAQVEGISKTRLLAFLGCEGPKKKS